jgi:hypothetical protein
MNIFLESFDKYGTTPANLAATWNLTTSDWTIASTGGRTNSGRYVTSALSTRTAYRSYPASAVGSAGIALYDTAVESHYWRPVAILDGTSAQIYVRILGSTVDVFRGTVGTDSALLATASGVAGIANSTWFYLEIQWTISSTVGTVKVLINGTTVIDATGLNTKATANATASAFEFLSANSGDTCRLDDIYICDNNASADLLGAVNIEYLTANADGTTIDFTPSTGSNYQNINEDGSNGDTDYNSSDTAGDYDTFPIPTPSLTGSVRSVQVCQLSRLESLTSRTLAAVARSGGTDYFSDAQTINSISYAMYFGVFQVNPDTSAAWTLSEVSAMEFGYKLAS